MRFLSSIYERAGLPKLALGGVVAMVLVSYDISNDKLRTKFAKFLSKYGYRLQYSLFKIENSDRILNNIIRNIENDFEKKFEQSDSVYIVTLSASCDVRKYGYAKKEDEDIIIIG